MAERTEIEVVVTPGGEVRLKTSGLKGQTCLAETEALEKALGKVLGRARTSEYYQQAGVATTSVRRS